MNRITTPIRVRALAGAIRVLGRAVDGCIERLLLAGMDAPAIQALYNGDGTVEHPDIAAERLLTWKAGARRNWTQRALMFALCEKLRIST